MIRKTLLLLSVLLHAPTPTFAFLLPTTTTPPSSRTTTTAMAAFSSSSAAASLPKNPIVIFPAQFGIAQDYEEMIAELNARGHPAYAVDLKRFDWLKITKSAVTAGTCVGNLIVWGVWTWLELKKVGETQKALPSPSLPPSLLPSLL